MIVMCVMNHCATAAQGVAAKKRPCMLVIEKLTGNLCTDDPSSLLLLLL